MIKVISITPENPEMFDEEIKKKPAFVKIYQPWCGYCKALAPIWDDMAKNLEKDYTGDISIIEVHGDATNNINSEYVKNVNGYPTLFLITEDGKKRDYEGNRSLEDMIKFVVKHAGLQEKSNRSVTKIGGRKMTKQRIVRRRGGKRTRKLRTTRRQRRHRRTYSRVK
jgi:protein disulfide-isomerase-like protein